jgi:hypothetical protein
MYVCMFICGYLRTLAVSDRIASSARQVNHALERCGRTQCGPHSRHYPGISLERLRITMKNSARIICSAVLLREAICPVYRVLKDQMRRVLLVPLGCRLRAMFPQKVRVQ